MAHNEKRFFLTLLIFTLFLIISGSIFITIKEHREDTKLSSSESTMTSSEEEPKTSAPESTTEGREEEAGYYWDRSKESSKEETSRETAEPSADETQPSADTQPVTEPEPGTPAAGRAIETGVLPVTSWITQDFLDPNPYSRPQIPLTKVNNIVVHWVANPGSTAEGNREYFANLKDKEQIGVSSHFIIGLNGEILYVVPANEVAYANAPRNEDTISIENCHPDWDGKFNSATYNSLIRLCAYLCEQYDLTADALIRHHDVSGKDCPKYYVLHPEAWEQLKEDVRAYMQAHPDIINEQP